MSAPATARRALCVLSLAALTACGSSARPAPATGASGNAAVSAATTTGGDAMAGMEGHAGHNMAGMGPIVIPAGAMITEADVHFMQGMIAHHAQAIHMTRMASSAGASARVLKLASKIDLSQAGEIVLMQGWLGAYKQSIPDTSSWRTMMMAGMLTTAQLDELAAARGTQFDKLFLRFMIQHHEGALSMVTDLMKSPRAGQEVDISVFANDVDVTQRAEIGLMWQMLRDIP